MSASLVGSEMCIRDSILKSLSRFKPKAPSVIKDEKGLPVHATAEVAVSYTHLTLPTICSV
eukprot:13698658-Alexandrium_andersonii.AAC.1